MDENGCPVCLLSDRERFSLYYDGRHKLYRCGRCRFVSAFPGPGDDWSIESYEDYYHLDWAKNRRWQYEGREATLQDIAERIRSAGGSGRLLDVGCGDGHFIDVCQRMGFQASGVEDSRALSDYAREQTGAEISFGRYAEEMFEPSSFDVISFIQVLEHVPQPRPLLEFAKIHLKPRGLLCIEVPSRYAPHFLLYRATRLHRFVRPPKGVVQGHVGYHHPGSVRVMASRKGFDEVSLTTGRWAPKYSGWKHRLGSVLDPVLEKTEIGGILYLGRAPEVDYNGPARAELPGDLFTE